jgi:hypothetical protein
VCFGEGLFGYQHKNHGGNDDDGFSIAVAIFFMRNGL